jgi:hypothetical protein
MTDAPQAPLIAALSRLSRRIANEQGTQEMFDALEAEYAAIAAQVMAVDGPPVARSSI